MDQLQAGIASRHVLDQVLDDQRPQCIGVVGSSVGDRSLAEGNERVFPPLRDGLGDGLYNRLGNGQPVFVGQDRLHSERVGLGRNAEKAGPAFVFNRGPKRDAVNQEVHGGEIRRGLDHPEGALVVGLGPATRQPQDQTQAAGPKHGETQRARKYAHKELPLEKLADLASEERMKALHVTASSCC